MQSRVGQPRRSMGRRNTFNPTTTSPRSTQAKRRLTNGCAVGAARRDADLGMDSGWRSRRPLHPRRARHRANAMLPRQLGRCSSERIRAVLIARLALDRALHRKGLGGVLLADSSNQIVAAMRSSLPVSQAFRPAATARAHAWMSRSTQRRSLRGVYGPPQLRQ